MIYILLSSQVDEFKNDRLANLKNLKIPFVVIHNISEDLNCYNVGLDGVDAGLVATRHLIEHGYHKEGGIGFVNWADKNPLCMNLFSGYTQSLEEGGISVKDELIFKTSGPGTKKADELARTILKNRSNLPRALLVAEDSIAYGMINEFQKAGVRVPEEIAIIGFGDDLNQAYIKTNLTTLNQSSSKKGEKASELLLKQIKNISAFDDTEFFMQKTKLQIRESCGCKSFDTYSKQDKNNNNNWAPQPIDRGIPPKYSKSDQAFI